MIATDAGDGSHDGEDDDRRVEAVIRLGERLGYLTYEMLNDMLPDRVIAPGRLDAFLDAVDRKGIRLIDEADAPPLL
jgi:hypothetical protein